MEKTILLAAGELSYTVRRSRRSKQLKLAVYPNGTVIVTVPFSACSGAAEEFIRRKQEWVVRKVRQFAELSQITVPKPTAREYVVLRARALVAVREQLVHFNAQYGYSYGSVTIRNQKTRWGSCSRKKTLSFNYKIIFLPPHLADYIIVHELCHLAEFNHSPKFWRLVAQTIPDYAARKKELRKISFSL